MRDALLFAILTTVVCAQPVFADSQDPCIVVVNGRKVDVAPLLEWLKTRKGERPLKHWKEIQALEDDSSVGGWQHCRVKIERGEEKTVYVDHLPGRAKAFL